jgi:hypothetical protein
MWNARLHPREVKVAEVVRAEEEKSVSILVRTSEMRGDHAADVAVAIRPIPNETVGQLISRCRLTPTDVIEIRPLQEKISWR